jgi:ATP-dependent DNA helicase RecG
MRYPAEVDQILALPPAEAINQLSAVPESQWFERKSGRVQAKDLAVALVALANAEGGCIVVGLEAGTVRAAEPARANDLRQAAMGWTVPTVRVRIDEFVAPGDSEALLIYRVDPGERVHELRNGDCYLRVGDESRKLSFAQRQELEYDRGVAPYDGTPAGISMSRLSKIQLERYRTAIGSATTRDMLHARGLLTLDNKITVAAYLLFGDHPQNAFPQAHVRVLRYTEVDRGTGSRLSLDDQGDMRCEGSLPMQVTAAAEAIERFLPRRRVLTEGGRFEGLPVIPRDAWLEGVVNAVLHRSYSAAGDHIRVEIFPDRMEISSPGRFPGLVDPTRPLEITRYARNPRIARVCSDLGIAQELGEGIRRIYAEMRRRGLTDPIYSQTAAGVRLLLAAADAVPGEVLRRLPSAARRVLDELRRADRPLGTGQVAELLGIARPTAGRHLATLRDHGLVVWEGDSPKDPRATWRLA